MSEVSREMTSEPEVEALAARLLRGERGALARGITWIESSAPHHRPRAAALLERVMPASGGALRLGVTGVPGVGKSTFLDALGVQLTQQGRRVAVLAIDPTSPVTGGSILGDKTRMARLAARPEAFIRPSPSGGTLGGASRRTRETLLLCEAAGYDVVVIETVGVGQSETVVAEMVDVFLALMLPGAGDELQGIKRGLLERVDLVAVNKADGEGLGAAERASRQLEAVAGLLRRDGAGAAVVRRCSALTGVGIEQVWQDVLAFHAQQVESGRFARRRREQAGRWMWALVEDGLIEAFRGDPTVARALPDLERRVREGECPPTVAAERLLASFLP